MSEQCQAQVYTGGGRGGGYYSGHQCTRTSTDIEDGEWRCKQHSKAAKEARKAKAQARWDAQWAGIQRAGRRDAEQRRRAECFPALLDALEPFVAWGEAVVVAGLKDAPEDTRVIQVSNGPWITIGDIRKARTAIREAEPEGGGK